MEDLKPEREWELEQEVERLKNLLVKLAEADRHSVVFNRTKEGMNIIENAMRIAKEAHEGQFRKWTAPGHPPEPYFNHPYRVATQVGLLGLNENAVAAAFLHDVIEDVALKQNKLEYYQTLISNECNQFVLEIVMDLTSPSEYPGWEHSSRDAKNKANFEHMRHIEIIPKQIKMCDRFDNLADYQNAPKKYMVNKYLPESRTLLGICRYTNEAMGLELEKRIEEAEAYFNKV